TGTRRPGEAWWSRAAPRRSGPGFLALAARPRGGRGSCERNTPARCILRARARAWAAPDFLSRRRIERGRPARTPRVAVSAHRDGRDRIIILPARDTLLARDRQEAGSARPMTGRSGQQLAEQRDVNRLDQVVIEARGARPLPVFFLSPARERHQSGLLGLGSCSESP